VVLASYVGPVPYELEDVYPANVRANGVKQMGPAQYERARPLLAARLAAYLEAHAAAYRGAVAFAEGRYGEVVGDAAARAGADVVLLPRAGGAAVKRLGRSTPRKYWEKYWIQLFLQIRDWLPPAAQRAADQRLLDLDVEWSLP
jgi:predicted RNA-binding protein